MTAEQFVAVRAWRLAGDHVCTCRWPAERPIGTFEVTECSACGRIIMPIDTAAELIERLMRAGAVAP